MTSSPRVTGKTLTQTTEDIRNQQKPYEHDHQRTGDIIETAGKEKGRVRFHRRRVMTEPGIGKIVTGVGMILLAGTQEILAYGRDTGIVYGADAVNAVAIKTDCFVADLVVFFWLEQRVSRR